MSFIGGTSIHVNILWPFRFRPSKVKLQAHRSLEASDKRLNPVNHSDLRLALPWFEYLLHTLEPGVDVAFDKDDLGVWVCVEQ